MQGLTPMAKDMFDIPDGLLTSVPAEPVGEATVQIPMDGIVLFHDGIQVPLTTTMKHYLKRGVERAGGKPMEVTHARD